MTLPIIIGNARDQGSVGIASSQHDGNADKRCRGAEEAIAIGGDWGWSGWFFSSPPRRGLSPKGRGPLWLVPDQAGPRQRSARPDFPRGFGAAARVLQGRR